MALAFFSWNGIMLMQVTTLVFLFLTRIHCPKNESTLSIFSKRYGKKILREVSEFIRIRCLM